MQLRGGVYRRASVDGAALSILHQQEAGRPFVLLGGGTNVLVGDMPQDVLAVRLRDLSIELVQTGPSDARIRASAAVVWDDLVSFALKRGWCGAELLSGIPGSVGGAPNQNIGAQGLELAEILHSVDVYDIELRDFRSLRADQCEFSHRGSVFKRQPGRFIIVSVSVRVRRAHVTSVTYRPLRRFLLTKGANPDAIWPAEIRELVLLSRKDRIPDPLTQPNVGSVFVSLRLNFDNAALLGTAFPAIVRIESESGVKVPPGSVLEACGIAPGGHLSPNIRTADSNCNILINTGAASYLEFNEVTNELADLVLERCGLPFELEPMVLTRSTAYGRF
jgi:UDP-N-acetylmuramate dehydrogenase